MSGFDFTDDGRDTMPYLCDITRLLEPKFDAKLETANFKNQKYDLVMDDNSS